jgi:hypothetical protein
MRTRWRQSARDSICATAHATSTLSKSHTNVRVTSSKTDAACPFVCDARGLVRSNEKYIPGPATELRIMCVDYFRSIAKPIAIRINPLRLFIIQSQSLESQLRQVLYL